MPDVTVRVNGESIALPAGSLITAAIARARLASIRRSVTGEPRGPLCGMGICFECRATVNGQKQVRTCQRLCEEGMEISTDG